MSREDLIASLTEGVTPVRRLRPQHGLLMVGFATLLAAAAAIFVHGFWMGVINGEASAYFWITNGLLLVVGVASSAALVAGALPRVGTRANGPLWAAAMLAVVPVAAIIGLLSGGAESAHALTGMDAPMYWRCSFYALIASGLVAFGSVAFLRRGAPVSLERSGWLTGLAAGSLGSLAYGVTCSVDSLTHVGLTHVVPVAIAALIGRIVVPPLIRW